MVVAVVLLLLLRATATEHGVVFGGGQAQQLQQLSTTTIGFICTTGRTRQLTPTHYYDKYSLTDLLISYNFILRIVTFTLTTRHLRVLVAILQVGPLDTAVRVELLAVCRARRLLVTLIRRQRTRRQLDITSHMICLLVRHRQLTLPVDLTHVLVQRYYKYRYNLSNRVQVKKTMPKYLVDGKDNGCSGMYYRTQPSIQAFDKTDDTWPRNGTVVEGVEEVKGWVKVTANGKWLPLEQHGKPVLHLQK